MNELHLEPENGGGRFPGFDTLAQTKHWDRATQAIVGVRLGMLAPIRFFTPLEEATANALFDQLLYQRDDPRVPVTQLVDSRLAEQQTDGWHYEDMPNDQDAWRQTLDYLNSDARAAYHCDFADCDDDQQHALLDEIHDRGGEQWRGMAADRVWSLWTRYACTAFYSHPWAWNEIGFAGPAYPRGYKNLGLDRREPFEVADVRPNDNPVVERANPETRHPSSGSTRTGSARSGGTRTGADRTGDDRPRTK